MLQFLKKQANRTLTENAALTNITTGSDCLDLFATIGALRNEADTDLRQNVVTYIKAQLDTDMKALEGDGAVSLLGKWLPSVNAHNADTVRYGKIIAKALGMTEAEYRRTLTKLRARIVIIENSLRDKDYTFDYEKQPSKAMMKYRKAFLRNDGERYKGFLDRVAKSEAKLHTGTVYPYDVIRPILSGSINEIERRSVDVTWNALEDFTQSENALAVIDGSGSMYGYGSPKPAEIALSFGVYFAERSKGAFANHFITFSG